MPPPAPPGTGEENRKSGNARKGKGKHLKNSSYCSMNYLKGNSHVGRFKRKENINLYDVKKRVKIRKILNS